jgi:hypothetical protein
MKQLAGWDTDYIKVDSCQPVAWRDGLPDDPGQYGRFRDAIGAAAKIRPMTYGLHSDTCSLPSSLIGHSH